jgi:anionic cell wall polymer biosynthesis LytR-Cps2A-Psr (LCP) family protein
MVNIVFLGKGGESHDGGGLTDSIIVAGFNYAAKEINLIAVPRDLWYSGRKINSVFSIEGSSGIKNDLSQITGLQINYFMSVDFSNFISAIDALGGIEADNPKTWEDNFYPIKGKEEELCGFTPEYNAEINQKYKGFQLEKQYVCRYEQLRFEKGPVKLDGATALKYVRSRHSVEYGSDFARGERAQAVLAGIGKKLISQNLLDQNLPVIKKLSGLVSSDLSLNKVAETIKLLGNLSAYKIRHTNLTDQNVLVGASGPGGAFILVPKAGQADFHAVRALITPNY